MPDDDLRALRPSVLYAGIEVMRECTDNDRMPGEALRFIRQGNAGRTSFDYKTAEVVAGIHGWEVFSGHHEIEAAFRQTLRHLVLLTRPTWVKLLPSGRGRVVPMLNDDLTQCLQIADLLGFSDVAISWWDELAALGRQWDEEERLAIGRIAEERAMNRERAYLDGTGLEPRWISIDDNAAGYDIRSWRLDLSRVPREQYVEVKGSTMLGTVHLSRQQWQFAIDHPAQWELQVWLDDREEPTVLGVDNMRRHMAVNQGAGRWAQMEIPTDALVPIRPTMQASLTEPTAVK